MKEKGKETPKIINKNYKKKGEKKKKERSKKKEGCKDKI